jgi:hypothetical protein
MPPDALSQFLRPHLAAPPCASPPAAAPRNQGIPGCLSFPLLPELPAALAVDSGEKPGWRWHEPPPTRELGRTRPRLEMARAAAVVWFACRSSLRRAGRGNRAVRHHRRPPHRHSPSRALVGSCRAGPSPEFARTGGARGRPAPRSPWPEVAELGPRRSSPVPAELAANPPRPEVAELGPAEARGRPTSTAPTLAGGCRHAC